MRTPLLTIPLLLLALTACQGSFSTTIGDHSITAKNASFSYGELRSTDQGTAINLGGKKLLVTATQILWAGDHSLPLPPEWRNLELTDSGNTIIVTVDGKMLTTIHPAT